MTLSELFTPWRTIKRLCEDNERLIKAIIEVLKHLKNGEWTWGFERWPDKPALYAGRTTKLSRPRRYGLTDKTPTLGRGSAGAACYVMVNVEGNDMKHSYGLTVGVHFRQRDYTRGQTLWKWLLSVGWGALKPWNPDELHRLGGYEKHSYWARVTVLGVSVQIGLDHGISNWARRT